MRIGFMVAAIFALGSGALADDYGRPTAILVSPIHEAQIVRGDDGKDHVEYELLVVNVFSEPVTLSSVTVLDPAGKELMRIEGGVLAAATQTLFAKTATPVVSASAAVSVDVDLMLPPDTADCDEVGRAFRLMPATCSDRSRPPVPIHVGRGGGSPADWMSSLHSSLGRVKQPATRHAGRHQ